MVYQQIMGIPMSTKCAPLIADLFLFCYEMNFMHKLHKSKQNDLIDMFNDTSRYFDDIFTIDDPEFVKHMMGYISYGTFKISLTKQINVLQTRRVKYEGHFVSSGSKIGKRLRRRKYDPVIIERTVGLVLGPNIALYRTFLKHCTLTNKVVGTK